jgi:hypothetical protein
VEALIGKEIGRLLILQFAENKNPNARGMHKQVAHVECACGERFSVALPRMLRGSTTMCSPCRIRFMETCGVLPREKTTIDELIRS